MNSLHENLAPEAALPAPADDAAIVRQVALLGLAILTLLTLAGGGLWLAWLATAPAAQFSDATWFFLCH